MDEAGAGGLDPSREHRRLPCPMHPEGLQQLAELVSSWGYDTELFGDFQRTGLVVHAATHFHGRVTIRPLPHNPAWQVEAIHASFALTFHCELTRERELRWALQLALRAGRDDTRRGVDDETEARLAVLEKRLEASPQRLADCTRDRTEVHKIARIAEAAARAFADKRQDPENWDGSREHAQNLACAAGEFGLIAQRLRALMVTGLRS